MVCFSLAACLFFTIAIQDLVKGHVVVNRPRLNKRQFDLGSLAGLGGASGLGSSLGGGGFGGYGSEEAGGFGTGQGKPLESNGGCPSYYMIGARGTTEGPGGSMAYNTVSEKVMATIPGGARRELDQYSTSADYTMTVTEGSRTEVQMISAEISKCPKTVFVLLGYSKGAMV